MQEQQGANQSRNCVVVSGRLLIGISLLFSFTAKLLAQEEMHAFTELPEAPAPQVAGSPSTSQGTGSISGVVTDLTGAAINGAQITLENLVNHQKRVTASAGEGTFIFPSVEAGAFFVAIEAKGFAPPAVAKILLHAGEDFQLSPITMPPAIVNSIVRVGASSRELAQEQIRIEEKQRFLYLLPNFYVSYASNPAPLTAKQKLSLAVRTSLDPSSFVLSGIIAGVRQWRGDYKGYGQGAEGYGKRYGAAEDDIASGVLIGEGVLPVLLRQDPRYFYNGTGSVRSRVRYALLTILRTKGDNGKWQPNYSGICGDLAASAVSNSYLPKGDKEGAVSVVNNALIGFAFRGVVALEQEFLLRKLTTHSKDPGTVGHE